VILNYPQFRLFAAPKVAITSVTNNGSGGIRVWMASGAGQFTGKQIRIVGVTGVLAANAWWPSVIPVSNFALDLPDSAIGPHFYTGGGQIMIVDPDGLPHYPGPQLADGSLDQTPGYEVTGSRLHNSGLSPLFDKTLSLTTAGGYTFAAGNTTAIGPLLSNLGLLANTDPIFPCTITCNAGANDLIPPKHDYDVFVTQRRDPGWYPIGSGLGVSYWNAQCLKVTYPTVTTPVLSKSGTIQLALNQTAVNALLPGNVATLSALPAGSSAPVIASQEGLRYILKNVAIYWIRRSNGAIQWATLYNAPAPVGTL